MNIKIIVNPRAGNGRSREVGYEAEKYLCDRGIEYSLDATYRSGGAQSLAQKAVKEGFDLIIAVGGDGTLNEIVNGIIGEPVTLAIIPGGKQNNFARSLGIDPDNTQLACEIALSDNARNIDVGKINDRYFLNSISFGIGAKTVSEKEMPMFKNGTNYVMKLFSALRGFKSNNLEIKIGDLSLNSKAMLTKVHNGKFFGGSFMISPDTDMQDGLLDICMLSDVGKLGFLRNLPRLISGDHKKKFPFTELKAQEIVVSSLDPVFTVYDGEVIENSSSFTIGISGHKVLVKSLPAHQTLTKL